VSLLIKAHPDLSGRLYHYSGEVVLRFSPSAWKYFLEGKDGSLTPIRGVTKTLKIIGGRKTDMLIGWACKKDFEKFLDLVAECLRGDGFVEAPWEDIAEMVRTAKLEHRALLETAGDVGHSAHEHLELIAKSLITVNDARLGELLAKWPEDERSCNAAIAAVAFLVDHRVRFLSAEQRVLSREWMVCGTMDGDVLIDDCGNADCPCARYAPFKNKRCVLDYKTSNGVYSSMFGQMALYRKASTEEKNFETRDFSGIYDGSVLLRLGKDERQEFEAWFTFGDIEYQQHLALFKQALDLKESVDAVDGWMDAIRDEVQAKAKLVRAAARDAAHRIACPKSKTYVGARMTKCFEDGTQCAACDKIYLDRHPVN
jgi:hypothetical protein